MKKIFSFLCALTVLVSASAAPVAEKSAFSKRELTKELRQQRNGKKIAAKTVNFKSLDKKTVNAKAVAERPEVAPRFEGAKVAPANAPKAKAPKAKNNVVTINISEGVKWIDQVAAQGYWQIYGADDTYAQVSLSNNATDEAAGEYAWADLDHDWCFYKLLSEYDETTDNYPKHYFSDGSCTITVAANGDITAVGSFTGEDGNTYNITLSYIKPVVPTEPIVINFEDPMLEPYFYSDGTVELTAENDEAEVLLNYLVQEEGSALGEFNTEDFDLSWSYINYQDTKMSFVAAHAVVTQDEENVLHVTAELETEEGYKFNITMFYEEATPPTPESSETITADVTYKKETVFFWTISTFEAEDANNAIYLGTYESDIFGTWEVGKDADFTGTVTPKNGEESEIYSGEITISAAEDGFTITGKVLCYNSVEYTLNLTYKIPDPTRTENLTIAGLKLDILSGAWQLSGFNEDSTKYVSIAAYADEVSGAYTEADLAADYTVIYADLVLDESGDMVSGKEFTMLSAELNVVFNEADSTVVITGTYLGQDEDDVPEFTLNLSGRIPAEVAPSGASAEHVNFEMKDMIFTQTESYWDLKGEDPGTGYFLEIRSVDAAVAGTYTEANLDDFYTYVGTGNSTYFDIKKANVEVSFAEGLITIQGQIVFVEASSKDTIYAAINVTNDPDADSHPDYDAKDADFNVTFPTFNVITDYIAEYGELYVTATNSENATVTLLFIVDPATTALEEGVYNVLNDGTAPFVYAGQGLDDEGYLNGSYAAHKDASGYITTPIWWIVSGTAKVDANGNIVVDALNSYDRTIHAVLGSTTGIENVELTNQVQKVVVDGQLFIIRDNKMFNVQGAQVR